MDYKELEERLRWWAKCKATADNKFVSQCADAIAALRAERDQARNDARPKIYHMCQDHAGLPMHISATVPIPPLAVCPECERLAKVKP